MGSRDVGLELRYIAERTRKRMRLQRELSSSAWSPKVLDNLPGERILVVAPHPDDEAIGCGGSILKLIGSGRTVRVLFLSTSYRDRSLTETRRTEGDESLEILGVREKRMCDLDFTKPSRVDEEIRHELETFDPDLVAVPSPVENEHDHLVVCESYRKVWGEAGSRPKTAYFEIWNPLIPNVVVDVTDCWNSKSRAIQAHKSQNVGGMYLAAAQGINLYRAALSGIEGYAEAFLLLDQPVAGPTI